MPTDCPGGKRIIEMSLVQCLPSVLDCRLFYESITCPNKSLLQKPSISSFFPSLCVLNISFYFMYRFGEYWCSILLCFMISLAREIDLCYLKDIVIKHSLNAIVSSIMPNYTLNIVKDNHMSICLANSGLRWEYPTQKPYVLLINHLCPHTFRMSWWFSEAYNLPSLTMSSINSW